jgi:hypothetical protein
MESVISIHSLVKNQTVTPIATRREHPHPIIAIFPHHLLHLYILISGPLTLPALLVHRDEPSSFIEQKGEKGTSSGESERQIINNNKNKTKQNKTKQNKTKQNKTKQNKTKQ